MTIEEKIKGESPDRVLPQWKRQIHTQKQRMKAFIIVAVVSTVLGVAGFYFWPQIPGWLRLFCSVCFALVPFQIFGFFADRHILLAYKRDVIELEKLLEERSRR